MAGSIFLIVSLIGLAFSVSTLMRIRHLGPFVFFYFLGAWIAGELPLHFIAWQALATLAFAAGGALESGVGVLGLAVTFVSWGCLLTAHGRALAAGPQTAAALAESGLEPESQLSLSALINPFAFRRPGVERIRNIAYCDVQPRDRGRRNLLDILRPSSAGQRRPILLQIHGGGWVYGDKEQQGQPLMNHLAQRGWVCFASNYRLGPQARFPDQIVDVKRAIAWIREHADEYGADPDFLCVTGGSAGGHLSALTALTENDPAYQPGFEEADTRIAAAVPFYGIYDFLDRHGHRARASMAPFLTRMVFPGPPDLHRELWENACPLSRVHSEAPPFLVIHGTHDSLAFNEDAHDFVEALRGKSRNEVLLVEYPGAQHAFEIFHSVRTTHAVHAVTSFLERVHRRYTEGAQHGQP